MNSLMSMMQHPSVESKLLVDKLMDITEKGPKPDKAPWRIILGRLEIFTQLLQW